jgi:ankyrin repeat protein
MSSPLKHLAVVARRSLATATEPISSSFARQSAFSPLHVASRQGDIQLAEAVLRSAGAQQLLNAPEHEGLTPLHLAAQSGHLNVVERLVAHGASPLAKTQAGVTPKQLAEAKLHVSQQYAKVVELLAQAELKQASF